MKTVLALKTVKNGVLAFLLVVLFVSFQVGAAGAGLIDITNPGNLNPFATTNVTDSSGQSQQYGYGSVWDPTSQPGFINNTTWSFAPNPLSLNTASANQASTVTYDGSSLIAAGSGSVSTNSSSASSHSGFRLYFTPSVDTTFHLWGSLLGDVFQAGYYISGMIGLDAFPPGGAPWYSLFINRNEEDAIVPVSFDLTGQLYAGVNYHFTIGANASLENAFYHPSPPVTFASADWNFNLSMHTAAPVPEPATMLLLGSGLVGLAGFKRKFWRK